MSKRGFDNAFTLKVALGNQLIKDAPLQGNTHPSNGLRHVKRKKTDHCILEAFSLKEPQVDKKASILEGDGASNPAPDDFLKTTIMEISLQSVIRVIDRTAFGLHRKWIISPSENVSKDIEMLDSDRSAEKSRFFQLVKQHILKKSTVDLLMSELCVIDSDRVEIALLNSFGNVEDARTFLEETKYDQDKIDKTFNKNTMELILNVYWEYRDRDIDSNQARESTHMADTSAGRVTPTLPSNNAWVTDFMGTPARNYGAVNNPYEDYDLQRALKLSLEQTAQLEETRPADIPAGLMNVGNSCYFNSLIQSYFWEPDMLKIVFPPDDFEPGLLPDELKREASESKMRSAPDESDTEKIQTSITFLTELQTLFTQLLKSNSKYCNPSRVLKTLLSYSNRSATSRDQEDPAEFQSTFVDIFKTVLLHKYGNLPKNAEELFWGKFKRIASFKDKKETEIESFPNWQISVDKHDEFYSSLRDSMKDTINVKRDGVQTSADRQSYFLELPSIFHFQLNRVVNKDGAPVKLHKTFDFPEEIYLDRFLWKNRDILDGEDGLIAQESRLHQKRAIVVAKLKHYENYPGKDREFSANLEHALQLSADYIQQERQDNRLLEEFESTLTQFKIHLEKLQWEADLALKEIQSLYDQPYLKKWAYVLHAVLVHQGQLATQGHYWAYIRVDGNWCKFNDTEVTKVEPEEVWKNGKGNENCSGYLLVYRRVREGSDEKEEMKINLPVVLLEKVESDNAALNKKLLEKKKQREKELVERKVDDLKQEWDRRAKKHEPLWSFSRDDYWDSLLDQLTCYTSWLAKSDVPYGRIEIRRVIFEDVFSEFRDSVVAERKKTGKSEFTEDLLSEVYIQLENKNILISQSLFSKDDSLRKRYDDLVRFYRMNFKAVLLASKGQQLRAAQYLLTSTHKWTHTKTGAVYYYYVFHELLLTVLNFVDNITTEETNDREPELTLPTETPLILTKLLEEVDKFWSFEYRQMIRNRIYRSTHVREKLLKWAELEAVLLYIVNRSYGRQVTPIEGTLAPCEIVDDQKEDIVSLCAEVTNILREYEYWDMFEEATRYTGHSI